MKHLCLWHQVHIIWKDPWLLNTQYFGYNFVARQRISFTDKFKLLESDEWYSYLTVRIPKRSQLLCETCSHTFAFPGSRCFTCYINYVAPDFPKKDITINSRGRFPYPRSD